MSHANKPRWVEVWEPIMRLPEGKCINISHQDMQALMDCNRDGIDRTAGPASDAYIREAIRTWPMLSEYNIAHNLMNDTYTFSRKRLF